MSSVPNEVLEDILQPLDRRTLDDAQFTDDRFLHVITNGMTDVCLRQIHSASISRSGHSAIWLKRPDGSYDREVVAHTFSESMQAMRSSRVAHLTFSGLVFTPELASLVLQTHTLIVVEKLKLDKCSCTELTTAQFQALLLRFLPTSLDIDECRLRACQISDGLVRALSDNRVRRIEFQNMVPVDGDRFSVTDYAIIDFCLRPDVQIQQEANAADEINDKLCVENGSITKGLFKRLVEASPASERTRPIVVAVYPTPVEYEDLDDFTLSSPLYGEQGEEGVYDFPGEPRGAIAAMDLQIVLSPRDIMRPHDTREGVFVNDYDLVVIRARRPNSYFRAVYDEDGKEYVPKWTLPVE